MTTQPSVFPVQSKNVITQSWQQAWHLNRTMTLMIAISAVVAVLAGIGLIVDNRIVVGLPVWAKTAKFTMSFVAYGATLLWMFSYIKKRSRYMNFFLSATGGLLLIELALLVTQAIRGRAMHFNYSTVLDGTLYTIMATSIFILWAISIVMGFIMLRQSLPGKAFAWSIRLGLALSVAGGFGLGMLMTSPTASQLAKMEAGDPDAGAIIGAHTVGAEDGGPGLPLLGWSTTHGDLRIPHFFGLHALQAIPLLGWFLARQREHWLKENHKLGLVLTGTFGYIGWVGLVTWQALRGQSIMAPDWLTLATFAGLVTITLSLASIILLRAYSHSKTMPLNLGQPDMPSPVS